MRLAIKFISTFAWLLVLPTIPLVAHAAVTDIGLVVGQQRILSAPGVTRIAIANPSVADVKVISQSQVLVTAVGSGRTELTVWTKNNFQSYNISVTRMDPSQLKREVRKMLGSREGISVRVVRNNVFIEGSAITLSDLEKVEEITELYPQVKNFVKLDPSAHSQIAQALNQELARVGLENATAAVVGSTIFLEGMVDSEAELKKAEIITRGISRNIQSVLRVGSSKLVELDVEFVEIAKNTLNQMGITWPTNLQGQVGVTYNRSDVFSGTQSSEAILGMQAEMTTSLGMALQFNDGVSRVLARPRLITTSRQEASFLAGGEVPIPLITQNQMSIEYKEYGIRLRITPIAEASGTIQAKVLTEVSQVDPSVSINGYPGFLTRRVDTEVTVKDGETIILSGLLHLSENKNVSKVPFLGHIPILGELFKSRQFQERQTELVIFVTPRIVDPLSRHLRELSTHILKKYKLAEDEVGFDIFD
ncbi:MAG: pilus assembly protein N-terminal domain-containing protein [Myxococcota bacterium]|jgi:pilus assembly protein CpaC|nr:pilus assembly protein N-terminal domain-containing protein [Myxococcota bacterium]